MKPTVTFSPERLEYLKLLARQYPTVQSASTEINFQHKYSQYSNHAVTKF